MQHTFQHNVEGTSKPASSLPMTATQRFSQPVIFIHKSKQSKKKIQNHNLDSIFSSQRR